MYNGRMYNKMDRTTDITEARKKFYDEETLFLNSIPGMARSIIEASKESLDDGIEYKEDEEW